MRALSFLQVEAPKKQRRGHPEEDLQKATKSLLDSIAHPDVIYHHSVNEGKRTKAAAGVAKACGQRKGWWDWVIMWPGPLAPHVLFIELKAGKNPLSDDQKKFREAAEAIGAKCIGPLYTVDQFAAALREARMPFKPAILGVAE